MDSTDISSTRAANKAAISAGGYLGEVIAAGRPDELFRAYETRDARFDGRFFVGVKTTGIFCRPVCPARTPLRRNVNFFSSAASAFAAGLRPCLRCRPERAPVLRALAGGEALVARALGAIDAGDLNEGSMEDLSARIGVTSRHLRRLFETHLGATPVQVAQTRRLLFAKQLIEESALPLGDIAFAAGFNSVRRFNTAFRESYARAPSALRRSVPHAALDKAGGGAVRNASSAGVVSNGTLIRLGAMPVESFTQLLSFYRTRAFRGVEAVDDTRYVRSINAGSAAACIEVQQDARSGVLSLVCATPDLTQLPRVVARVKRMFDLDAPLAAVQGHLRQDRLLRPAVGVGVESAVRVPCAWDAFELAVRAVLGQQISVKAATTLSGRLVERFGALLPAHLRRDDAGPTRLFPPAEVLAHARVADLCALGIIRARAETVIALARHVAADTGWRTRYTGLDAFAAELTALPGIGPWTAHYIAMRGFADPDAFPASDLGLLRSARALGIATTPRELERHAERWRPWRAYAAQALWNFKLD